jgi:polar amino acid transport system substrate-binding protein
MSRLSKYKYLFVLCVLYFPVKTNAQNDTLLIGVEDVAYFPLYDFTEDRNNHAKALLDEFAKHVGIKFSYIPLPIKRFGDWLEAGKIDFRYPDSPLWKNEGDSSIPLIYSQPAINLVSGTIILRKNQHWQEDNIKRLGTLLGFHPTFWQPEIKAGDVTLVQHPSTTVLVQQLLHGYVDALDLEPSVVHAQLRHLKKSPQEAILAQNMRYQVYSYRLSTTKHPQVINQFDKFLENNPKLLKQLRAQFKIFDHQPYTN